MNLMKSDKGFTLVELLLGMAIVIVLAMTMIGILNPIALTGKARDSKRKEDLNKMKIAFEEYFNDKGTYPFMASLEACNQKVNCGKPITGMSNYLKNCLCDSYGNPYRLVLSTKWFKIVTNLDNKEDKDIPDGWYTDSQSYSNSGFETNDVNYGVSSSNILWYERSLTSNCNITSCFSGNSCNEPPLDLGCSALRGETCYMSSYNPDTNISLCNDINCQVPCCGAGCEEE